MYYATTTGKQPGIYKQLEDVFFLHQNFNEVDIHSFEKLKDARAYIKTYDFDHKVHQNLDKGEYVLYTDGSFNCQTSKCGIGILILKDNEIIKESSIAYPALSEQNSYYAEWIALQLGIQITKSYHPKKITIFVDNVSTIQAIENNYLQLDHQQIQSCFQSILDTKKELELNLYHVPAHKDYLFNERVDWLAKKACDAIIKNFTEWDQLPYKSKRVCLGYKSNRKKENKVQVTENSFKGPLTQENYEYIIQLIKTTKTGIALFSSTQWISWNLLCQELQHLLQSKSISFKVNKLRNYEDFKDTFVLKEKYNQLFIRRKKFI